MLHQLELMGIKPSSVKSNLTQDEWRNEELSRKEGRLSSNGTVIVNTGIYTGRSPNDRFIVKNKETEKLIDWGDVNLPLSEESFEFLESAVKKEMEQKDLFVFDGYAGADERYRLPLRVVTMMAWQGHFSHNMFIRPTENELEGFEPDFTILNASSTNIDNWKELGLNSKVFIVLNLKKKMAIIGGTEYGGEIKKSIFSALNFYLPLKGVMPMHCSANIGKDEDSALFFGLSGTGKTTLSTDPNRRLIGDDEHGWSDEGIFNFEGGCYAKCINLNEDAEPQIWNAIKSGAVLENVVVNKDTLKPDFDDGSLTENTRAAYPLDYIPGAVIPSVGGHPKVIIFLTADALGVLPPVSKLTKESAMFHFMSGYTSKLAGTERGIKEPKATFSACFGSPFMPRPASVYAKMLGEKILEHNTVVYLINTGWSGGPYGVGKRISIKYSRAMVTAALTGKFDLIKFRHDDTFNLDVPTECPGVPSDVLDPKNTWIDKDSYDLSAKKLAQMFGENFTKFKDASPEIKNAGPQIQ